jgi:hypothetical protein
MNAVSKWWEGPPNRQCVECCIRTWRPVVSENWPCAHCGGGLGRLDLEAEAIPQLRFRLASL